MTSSRSLLRGHVYSIASLLSLLFLSFLIHSPATTTAQIQDDDVVRVNTDVVVLNVTVLDGDGKFIRGLKVGDFKLFVDGREQPISTFTREETPFAAAMLLDTSGSMEERMMLARSAAIRFLEHLRIDDVAAIYRFDSEIYRVQEFSSSRDLEDFAFGLKAKGMTSLNDAIKKAADELSVRNENRRAIVVISDGADTKSSASAETALNAALAANATIYAVDMSSTVGATSRNLANAAVLRNFASKSGGRYVASPGGQAMRNEFTEIAEELSNQYTLVYSPPENAKDGRWHKLDVKLSRPDAVVRTRKGYHAPKR